MRGLLLKDWYMMRKYYRAYLLITVIVLAVSRVSDNIFFAFYPCLLCSMIPVNLLSLDERSGWMQYSGTLPYTNRQIVSAKYLAGLFSTLAVMAIAVLVQIIQTNAAGGGPVTGDYLVTLSLMWIFAMVNLSLCLPFVFRFGTEKGRIVYFGMIGMFFAGIAMGSRLFTWRPQNKLAPAFLLIGISILAIGLYALSWYLSVVSYRKRQL